MNKKLITAEELAEQLRLKPKTIHDWARKRKIPSIKISPKVIRFDFDEVLQSLNGEIHNHKATILGGTN